MSKSLYQECSPTPFSFYWVFTRLPCVRVLLDNYGFFSLPWVDILLIFCILFDVIQRGGKCGEMKAISLNSVSFFHKRPHVFCKNQWRAPRDTYFSKSCKITIKQHYDYERQQNNGFWTLAFNKKVFTFSKQAGLFSFSSQLGTENEHILRKLKLYNNI